MSPARTTAFQILLRVDGGGYASDLLLAQPAGLDSRDAGLASEIVFGVLRYQAQLDYLIGYFSGRPSVRLDSEVRIALRMAIYQLRYLDRIPPHAAVTDSVDLVKRAGKRSAAGFVNAVLRKVTRDPVAWPDRATELSMPAWLLARWDRRFGTETASTIAQAFLRPPETFLRIPPGASANLNSPLAVEATEIPGCFRLEHAGDSGGFRQQDISSQWVVTLLDLEPGQTLLDLCAAPGNKTAQALEAGVRVIACDHSLRRLRALDGLACHRVVLDATQPLPFRTDFERILLDAPCSGTGTLGRNPEIKWRLREHDLGTFQARQIALLDRAVAQLAPGGRLVYSTCSLEEEENQAVVEQVLPRHAARLVSSGLRLPGLMAGDGFFAAVIT
ncbi:MAG TPA: transcription antitermination factor NusB [Bryobacteraceae bacterium]|nr:transcription antitermination factor NusB [Bryobacteraceae bacterium]